MIILDYINNLSPFLQSILGTALFALLVWIGRIIIDKIKDSISSFKKNNQETKITKYIVYKYYLTSQDSNLKTEGYLIILKKAFASFVAGIIILSVGLLIKSTIDMSNIVAAIYVYLAIQLMLESFNWLTFKGLSKKELDKLGPNLLKKTLKEWKVTSKKYDNRKKQ